MRVTRKLISGWKQPVFDGGEKNLALPISMPAAEAGETLTLTHEILIPADEKTSAWFLETKYLSGRCRVLVDGALAREYESVFAGRTTDLTPLIKKGEAQTLTLEIAPKARPDGDFTFGEATLTGVGLTHFALADGARPLDVRTVFSDAGVRVLMKAEIENPNNYDVVLFRLCSPDGILIDVKSARPTAAAAAFDLPEAQLWEGLHANFLYRAEVVLQRDADVIDRAELSFGIRDFAPGDGGFFTMNGIKLPLNGAFLRGCGSKTELEALAALDANLATTRTLRSLRR